MQARNYIIELTPNNINLAIYVAFLPFTGDRSTGPIYSNENVTSSTA